MTLIYASSFIEFDISGISSDPLISAWIADTDIAPLFFFGDYLQIPIQYEAEDLIVEPIIQPKNYLPGSKTIKFTATTTNTGIIEGKGLGYEEIYEYTLQALESTQTAENPTILIDYIRAPLRERNFTRTIAGKNFPGVIRRGFISNIQRGTPTMVYDSPSNTVASFGGVENGLRFTFENERI